MSEITWRKQTMKTNGGLLIFLGQFYQLKENRHIPQKDKFSCIMFKGLIRQSAVCRLQNVFRVKSSQIMSHHASKTYLTKVTRGPLCYIKSSNLLFQM